MDLEVRYEGKRLWVDIIKSKYGSWRNLVEGKTSKYESL